jgi:hypothetical protein
MKREAKEAVVEKARQRVYVLKRKANGLRCSRSARRGQSWVHPSEQSPLAAFGLRGHGPRIRALEAVRPGPRPAVNEECGIMAYGHPSGLIPLPH